MSPSFITADGPDMPNFQKNSPAMARRPGQMTALYLPQPSTFFTCGADLPFCMRSAGLKRVTKLSLEEPETGTVRRRSSTCAAESLNCCLSEQNEGEGVHLTPKEAVPPWPLPCCPAATPSTSSFSSLNFPPKVRPPRVLPGPPWHGGLRAAACVGPSSRPRSATSNP